jgi:O-antigen/teichoic acid export membrane protein
MMADAGRRPGDDLAGRLVSGTAANVVGAVVGKVLDLVLLGLAVHRVGATAFGLVVIAQGLGMWPSLLEKGVGQTLVRLVAGDRTTEVFRSALTAGVLFYLVLGIMTVVVGVVFSHTALLRVFDTPKGLHHEAVLAADLIFVSAAIRLATSFAARVLVGRTSFVRLRAVELLRALAALLLGLVLVGGHPTGIVGLAAALLIADVLAGALSVWYVRHDLADFELRSVRRAVVEEHWRAARPVLAASGIGLAWSRVDPVIVGVGLGPTAATTYGIATAAYDMLQGFVEILYLGLLPTTTSLLAEGDGRRVGRLLARANVYVTMLVWPIAATLAVFSPEAVRIWFHADIAGVRPAMALAMALVVTSTVPTCLVTVIVGAGRVGSILRAQATAAVLNLAISIGLLAAFGVGAVFLGSVVGGALVAIRSSRVVREVIGGRAVDAWRGTVRPAALLLALLAAYAGVRVIGLEGVALASALAGALAVYLATALVWLVPRGDVRHLRLAGH